MCCQNYVYLNEDLRIYSVEIQTIINFDGVIYHIVVIAISALGAFGINLFISFANL
jgi:hypothetical protein